MTRVILSLVVILTTTFVLAAEPLKVYKLEAGHYLVTGTNVTVQPVNIVTPDVPTPPDPPVPVDELSKAVAAAVNKIPANDTRHEQSMKMTAVLQLVRDKVADGTLPHTSAGQATNLLAKAVLGRMKADDWDMLLGLLDASQIELLLAKAGGAYETWSPVLDLIEASLSKQVDKAGTVSVLNVAAVAVLSTVPDSDDAVATMQSGGPLKDNAAFQSLAEKYDLDWTAFLAFLMQLLQVLLPLIITYFPKLALVACLV